MFYVFFLLFLVGVSNSAKLVEQREIKTSSGKTFNCFYTINYNNKGAVNKKKSKVECDPDETGGTAIEVFDLPDVGKISLKHSVKKGKDAVQDYSPYTEPASAVMPMNCSCKVPFPTEMMEAMGSPEMTVMGRSLPNVLMTHDSESNRKVMRVSRELNRIGPILCLLLLPQIIAAIQAALAGRSLEVDKAQLREKFNRQLFGNGGLGGGALLGALTGGNNVASNAGGLLGGLTGGNNVAANAGIGSGALLGALTGGNNVANNAGGLLGGLTGGAGGGSNPLELLGGLAGSGANPADLLSIISSGGDPAELLSNPAVQSMIQQVVQQQMEEFMNNGGPEEMINQVMSMSDEEIMAMIMPYIPEDMQATVQEFAAMSDEEFFQQMMEQMGMNGGLEEMFGGMGGMDFNMTDVINEWEAPFDVYCDCLPTEMEHGLKEPSG